MAKVIGQDVPSGRPEPKPCGVWGDSQDGHGVEGVSGKSSGVVGISLLAGYILGETQTVEGGTGVYGENSELYGVGVRGQANNKGIGVSGISKGDAGVHGRSTHIGVFGTANNFGVIGTSERVGVRGSGEMIGVSGESGSGTSVQAISDSGVGVLAISGLVALEAKNTTLPRNRAFLASRDVAGYFSGNVEIGGKLTKAGGIFKIDHPLDPANKYLAHSFVESPDMKNIYDGIVVLDQNGEAIVVLPNWFDALNMSCCYQLTAIGAAGPNLYVADEIANNRFKIAGGTPGLKVSWQVTGIRRDAWANANRIEVEEEKPVEERGSYLHPHLYGQPEEKDIGMVRYPTMLKGEG